MAKVKVCAKGFLCFFCLDLKSSRSIFYVTSINVGGNQSMSFQILAKSFHDWSRYFVLMLCDPAWKFFVESTIELDHTLLPHCLVIDVSGACILSCSHGFMRCSCIVLMILCFPSLRMVWGR